MMMKSTLSVALLLASLSLVMGQSEQPAMGMQQQQQGGNNLLGGLMGTLTNGLNGGRQGAGGQQPGLLGGLNSLMNGQQMPMMNNMMGPQQQQQQMQGPLGGLMQQLQQLPQRGMQMINQLMSGVRNILPGGLGRGQAGSLLNAPSMGMQQQQQQGGLNLQGLTQPLNELTQSRLPNLNSLTQNLPNLNGLTQSLPNTNSLTQQLPGQVNQLGQQTRQLVDNLAPGLGQTLSNVLPTGGAART